MPGLKVPLADGTYQVSTPYMCAGFVVANGCVTQCAPILRRRISYWVTVAKRIESDDAPKT